MPPRSSLPSSTDPALLKALTEEAPEAGGALPVEAGASGPDPAVLVDEIQSLLDQLRVALGGGEQLPPVE